MASKIGIRDLKNRTSEIVKEVRESGAEYIVTLHGEPVAVLQPYTRTTDEQLRRAETEAMIETLESIADRVSKAWTSPKSGLELVEEQRR